MSKEKYDDIFKCWVVDYLQEFIVKNRKSIDIMKSDEDFMKVMDLCNTINISLIDLKNILEKKGLKIEKNEK